MKQSDFEPEPPTRPNIDGLNEQQQAAQLVRDWRECPPAYRRMMLRLARKGAELPKEKP